ncbi:MAG: hypothetical protein J5842_06790 [Lachnospiraceae bacterium]|nr:hypothetical protein [Lachnospiraceae bacterium]
MIVILLLPVFFICIYKLVSEKKALTGCLCLAASIIIYEAVTVLLANLLSIGSHLTPLTASVAFLIADLALIRFAFGNIKKPAQVISVIRDAAGNTIRKLKKGFRSLDPSEKLMVALSFVLGIILLFLALFTVPYNYDSMTYHLARIGHWIDPGSVGSYVTNIDRQLFSPVLSEYNLLFMMLLSGSDALLNLQQYLEMLASAYFLYHILMRLGTGRRFSVFGVFVFLSMPLTISQAITTQNDIGALMWYLIFVYFILEFMKPDMAMTPKKEQFILMLMTGMSVGFAFLMKVSVCASMIWFMPWVLVVCIKRKDNLLFLLRSGVTAVAAMLAVISETLIRTYIATGSLFSSSTSGDIMVATKNVKYIIVNILKNFSLLITQHILRGLNGVIYRFAISAGSLLQVEVNNEAISFHGLDFITWLNMGDDMYSHDRTPSAFAAYLALAGAVMLVISLAAAAIRTFAKRKEDKAGSPAGVNRKVSYGFVISAWLGFGFIMALLRWQPWGSRLMYPALVMAAMGSAHMLGVLFSKDVTKQHAAEDKQKIVGKSGGMDEKKVSPGIGNDKAGMFAVLLLTALAAVLAVRPLIYNGQVAGEYVSSGFKSEKRTELMFTSHSHLYEGYKDMIEVIETVGAKDIGVCISGDGYDYPLWYMLSSVPDTKFRHVIADEESMTVKDADSFGSDNDKKPDLILWIELKNIGIGDSLEYDGQIYTCGFISQAEGAQCYILFPDKIKSDISPDTLINDMGAEGR